MNSFDLLIFHEYLEADVFLPLKVCIDRYENDVNNSVIF